MLKRGFGALALTAFAFLIIWGTWKGDKPVTDSARKLMIRQAAAFEPVQETPAAPITTASIPAAPIAATPAAPVPASDQLLESARRAPVLAYNRPISAGRPPRDGVTGSVVTDPYGFGRGEPRNDLADKLKPTPIEGVRAARLPNRNLLVTQGTSIPCVLETAMSSDVAGFVSCVVHARRDVGFRQRGADGKGHASGRRISRQCAARLKTHVRAVDPRQDADWRDRSTGLASHRCAGPRRFRRRHRHPFLGAIRFSAVCCRSSATPPRSGVSSCRTAQIQINNTTGATNTAAGIAVEQSINIPPTLNKNQGELVNIFVARDVDFSSVYQLRRIETRTQILDRTIPGNMVAPAVVTK